MRRSLVSLLAVSFALASTSPTFDWALGIGGRLTYLWAAPGPQTDTFLPPPALRRAEALSPRLDGAMAVSVHVGHSSDGWAAGGAVGLARALFASPRSPPDVTGSLPRQVGHPGTLGAPAEIIGRSSSLV